MSQTETCFFERYAIHSLRTLLGHRIIKYTMELQEYADGGYDTLFLSEVNELHVCNLRDDVSDSARLATYDIPQELRREFFIRSL